ncbi:alcohol dehydrogenase GroES domain protein, partial [Amylocystis lapponica]
MATMKAVRYYGPGDIRVEQVPEPVAGDTQVKIKFLLIVCGSDVHAFFTPTPVHPTLTKPSYVTGETLPVVMGHECISGTITELGSRVDSSKFVLGQNVVVEPLLSCMETTATLVPTGCGTFVRILHSSYGLYTFGRDKNLTLLLWQGIGGRGGGLAEYIAVDQELVFVLPAGIPLEIGALMEPLSIAWHAVKRANFQAGHTALIVGAGPIGLLLIKNVGASWIGVSEPALQRRASAEKFRASAVFDPLAVDVPTTTAQATSGRGADVVFDCAGIQASITTAIAAVRIRGTVVNVAVWETVPKVNLNDIATKELMLTSTMGCDKVHEELLRAVGEGRLTGLEELITKKIALEDVLEEGIKSLIAEKDTQITLRHP